MAEKRLQEQQSVCKRKELVQVTIFCQSEKQVLICASHIYENLLIYCLYIDDLLHSNTVVGKEFAVRILHNMDPI
jgi:hypothetical protein